MSSKSKLVKKGDKGAKPEIPKPTQTDFLKEFRTRKETNKSAPPNASHDATPAGSRVTHPFAKYNTSGQLQCVLCSLQISTDKAWPFHLQSRKHKDIMASLKKSASKVPSKENGQTTLNRKVMGESTTNQPAKKLKSILKLPQTAQPPDPDVPAPLADPPVAKPAASVQLSSAETSDIPADFFDAPSEPDAPPPGPELATGDGKVPEGFFDDPKRDAKVRGVRPEEAMEREWEAFQRLMETETEQSELMVAQQDQLVQLERDFSETHQQSRFFDRAEELRQRQEALAPSDRLAAESTADTSGAEMGAPSDDESHSEFELELDWRAQAY